jgi:hypothetical protein
MHIQTTLRLLVCLLLLLSVGQVFADAADDVQTLEQERFKAYVATSPRSTRSSQRLGLHPFERRADTKLR